MRIIPVGGFLIRNLKNIHEKYPEIVHMRLGVADFYLLTSPDLVQEVLVTKQSNFIKGRYLQKTKRVFGEGLLTSEGEFHHRERRLVQPAFHTKRLNEYAKIMTSYSQKTLENWHDGQILDIHLEMTKLTMSIVTRCLFGTDVEPGQISKDLSSIIDYFARLSSPLSGLYQKLPSNKKYAESINRIDSLILELTKKRQDSRPNSDLLSMLLQAKDESGKNMSDSQIRDEVLILFAAGHETTANALTWTWYLLSQNPIVESKMSDEVSSLTQNPSYSDISKLSYTTNVFAESMRLYPPAWVLVREAVKDSEIGGYRIPKHAQVIMSQYVNHHDPRFFSNPEVFEPDRWTAEFKKELHKFAYFPFGGGPRSCIGEPFAWMEGTLILATISKNWKMLHVANHKVEMSPRITLRPRYGMKMKLVKR